MADKDAIRNETMQSALEFQRIIIAADDSGANICHVKTDETLIEEMFKLLAESYNIFASDSSTPVAILIRVTNIQKRLGRASE